MAKKHQPEQSPYTKLGNVLKDARNRLRDQETGRVPRVEYIAKLLGVKKSFVYQVEQGKKKPRDSAMGKWASVYGVNPVDLWKCLHRIPMDLVASLKEEPQPTPYDLLSQLT